MDIVFRNPNISMEAQIMPIIEYACVACGNHFEKLQKSAAACQAECPECGSAEVEKKLSIFSSAGASCSTAPSGGG